MSETKPTEHKLSDYEKYLYRRLGGWLMFIFVMAILSLVGGGIWVLFESSFFSFAAGLNSGLFSAAIHPSTIIYFVYMVAGIVLSSLLIYALKKRQLKKFKICFFANYGMYIAYSAYSVIKSYLNTQQYASSFSQLGSSSLYGENYFRTFYQSFVILFISLNVALLLVSIGLLIAWVFYFKRSKRVQVYFDPDYEEPEFPPYPMYPYYAYPAYYPYYNYGYGPYGANGQAAGYYQNYGYGQGYSYGQQAGYNSYGYPAPYPQQPGAAPPTAPQAPPNAPAPGAAAENAKDAEAKTSDSTAGTSPKETGAEDTGETPATDAPKDPPADSAPSDDAGSMDADLGL